MTVRLPNAAHETRPWRIRAVAPDFTVEDVWALPARGGIDDFETLIELMGSLDVARAGSLPLRVLWSARDQLGRWFGLGRISVSVDDARPGAVGGLAIPGTTETSLSERLPADLRGTATDAPLGYPFTSLYRTDTEFAAELSNRTVHAVLHLGWADQGDGRYRGQMAVYVKPRGTLGSSYMALIKPFRYCVVYPELMRMIDREWRARVAR